MTYKLLAYPSGGNTDIFDLDAEDDKEAFKEAKRKLESWYPNQDVRGEVWLVDERGFVNVQS